MGSYSSNMGEYSVGVRCFDGIRDCEECKTNYKSGYEFMYLSCGCGCKVSFGVCKQRPEYGNINVSIIWLII